MSRPVASVSRGNASTVTSTPADWSSGYCPIELHEALHAEDRVSPMPSPAACDEHERFMSSCRTSRPRAAPRRCAPRAAAAPRASMRLATLRTRSAAPRRPRPAAREAPASPATCSRTEISSMRQCRKPRRRPGNRSRNVWAIDPDRLARATSPDAAANTARFDCRAVDAGRLERERNPDARCLEELQRASGKRTRCGIANDRARWPRARWSCPRSRVGAKPPPPERVAENHDFGAPDRRRHHEPRPAPARRPADRTRWARRFTPRPARLQPASPPHSPVRLDAWPTVATPSNARVASRISANLAAATAACCSDAPHEFQTSARRHPPDSTV